MKHLRLWLRFQLSAQLLPVLAAEKEILVGGQAVMEGVMMRSPHAWAIAVRKAAKEGEVQGEIVTHSELLDKPSVKHSFWGWPILRGLASIGQSMALGLRALQFSTNVALEEIPVNEEGKTLKLSGWVMGLNLGFSLVFFIWMYKFLPLWMATKMQSHFAVFNHYLVFNLLDGAIRLAIFVGFLWGISRWKDIRRIFEYHGAEHKTVFAFEAGEELKPSNVQPYSTLHPRCGTSFLITVMLFSIIVYAFFPVQTFWARFAIRIVLLPFIVGFSYEIIRYAAKHRSSLFALMTIPGLWLQRITTCQPDDSQVECAIKALNESMSLEDQNGGERVLA